MRIDRHASPFLPLGPAARGVRAFSLIELVVVVVILAIVSAIAVPRMSSAAARSRHAAIAANLRELNAAAERYAAEHDGRSPAHDTDGSVDWDTACLVRRLTGTTDVHGGFDGLFGPYLRTIPRNPIVGDASIVMGVGPPRRGRAAWHFNPLTNVFARDDLVPREPLSPETNLSSVDVPALDGPAVLGH